MQGLSENGGYSNRLDLILRCEPFVTGKKYIDFLRIFRNGGVSALPIADIASYGKPSNMTLHKTADYLAQKPPNLTKIRFETFDGNEPGSSAACPFISGETWDTVFRFLPIIIRRLKGENCSCYISESLLIPAYFDEARKTRLTDYRGEIIKRGEHPDLPVLMECTNEFILADPSIDDCAMMKRDFWSYGTWGYILKNENRSFLRRCASTNECPDELVHEFFEKIEMIFMVRYELEGILLISHNHDFSKISEMINAEEINRTLSSV